MNSARKPQHSVAQNESELIRIPVGELIIALFERRRFLMVVTGIGMLLAAGCALLIPNEYKSVVQLMPPDQMLFSSSSMRAGLSSIESDGLSAAFSDDLLSKKTPGQTAIGVLGSSTSLDDIINRFDLRRVYHSPNYVDTRKRLISQTTFIEDKYSGIISISVTDSDRYRAQQLAEAYVDELNKLTNSLSTSSARRERIFLEQRLKSVKSDLDASSLALSQFSSHNATLDIQRQGEATVEAVGKLQGELIAAQSELSALKAIYADDNVRVRQARGQVDELQSQLRKMSGAGEDVNAADLKADGLMPSLRKLPLLGVEYNDLYRQQVMQETLYASLSKEYELARVEEAKEVSQIMVLDHANLPERKSSTSPVDHHTRWCFGVRASWYRVGSWPETLGTHRRFAADESVGSEAGEFDSHPQSGHPELTSSSSPKTRSFQTVQGDSF